MTRDDLIHKESEAVYRAVAPFKTLDGRCLEAIAESTPHTEKKRSRICCHDDLASNPQEMLICLSKETYIRPHRHFNKSESGLCLRGYADVVFFDEGGGILDSWIMGPEAEGFPFYYRIESPVFHCLIVRSEQFLFHEVSSGPCRSEDTEFAPWSPDETDETAVAEFAARLAWKMTTQFPISSPVEGDSVVGR